MCYCIVQKVTVLYCFLSYCVTAFMQCYCVVSWRITVVVHCFKCCVTVTCGVLLCYWCPVCKYDDNLCWVFNHNHLSCANGDVALCLLTSIVFILQHMWTWEQHHHLDRQWVSELCCYAASHCYQCGCTVQQESIILRYYLWAIWEPFFPMKLFMISVVDGALLLIIRINLLSCTSNLHLSKPTAPGC